MSVPPPSTRPAAFEPPQPPQPRPSVPSSEPGFAWWAPFLALVSAYGSALVLTAIAAGVAGAASGADIPTGVLLVGTYLQDGLLVVMAAVFAAASGVRPTPGAFGLRRISGRAMAYAGLAFAVFYGFLLVWSRLLDSGAKDDAAAKLGANDSLAGLVAVTILVAVVAPLVEETFFRGFLFGALRRAIGWLPAALASGVLFGLVHAGGTPLIFLVPLAVLGFVLCVLYRRTGSIVPGMGVHAFNNALALSVTLHWSVPAVLASIVAAPAIVIAIAWAVAEP